MKHTVQIYKSDVRGLSETEAFRRYATFNFGDYSESSRAPFGILLAINDETLAGSHTIFRHVDGATDILIVPLVGGLIFRDGFGNESAIGPEQIGKFSGQNGDVYRLTNPYKKDPVNYLQIWIKGSNISHPGFSQRNFDFSKRNVLIPIIGDNLMQLHSKTVGFIGLYDGRHESRYQLQNPKNGAFVFVINGVFECDNRLIETRDALAISNAESIEFEALSQNAMLLIIEVPLTP